MKRYPSSHACILAPQDLDFSVLFLLYCHLFRFSFLDGPRLNVRLLCIIVNLYKLHDRQTIMAGSVPEGTSGSPGSQNESTSGSPGPPGTPTYPPPISVTAYRSTLGSSFSSPASVGQIRSCTQSSAPGLRPRLSQTFAAGAEYSSSSYCSDSVASPNLSDIYNASDGVASPYKSGRLRARRQRPPIQQTTFEDILPPMENSAAAGIRDDQVESHYWDSGTDGDLDDIPDGMIGGWNSGIGEGQNALAAADAPNQEDDGENDKTLLGGGEGQEGQEDAEMEEAPLADGVASEDEDTIGVDDYLRDLFGEDEDEKEDIYSEDEDFRPRKRQKRDGGGPEKGKKLREGTGGRGEQEDSRARWIEES